MKIVLLAAGAADMFCGSCLRDSTLAGALRRAGQQVVLVPLYTPLRTEDDDPESARVFYGGLNVYLRQMSVIFRALPAPLRRWLDRPGLLAWAGRKGAGGSSARLGPMTLGILRGDHGPQAAELSRLIDYLRAEVRPDAITLPNAMFLGLARPLRQALGARVVCELTGEDLFLDGIDEPYRTCVRDELRGLAGEVDHYVATSAAYARHMSEYLGVDAGRIVVVRSGLPKVYFDTPRFGADPHPSPLPAYRERGPERAASSFPPSPGTPGEGRGEGLSRSFTVGYLARIAPEKGLDILLEAMILLKKRPNFDRVALRAAGYMAASMAPWLEKLQQRAAAESLDFQYLGEVDLGRKLAFLDSLDVLSVPTRYKEAKGLYIMEAAARGVPVVQPDHGSFPELLAMTGGGTLVRPEDPAALADGLYDLLSDRPRRQAMAETARAAAEKHFTDTRMAQEMISVLAGSGGNSNGGPRPGLRARGLTKSFTTANGSLAVLRGVDLEIAPGESLAILGPSGSGKSTLLNILGALDRSSGGEIKIGATDLAALSAKDGDEFRARCVGFVFQDHHLLPQCTALENVLLARLALGTVEDEHVRRATELLGQLGLADRLHHRPAELSGGERQRVSIARAMMNRPALLLCDEPTGNLDAATATRIGQELTRLAADTGTMLIVATHSPALAGMLQRRVRLENGRLVEA